MGIKRQHKGLIVLATFIIGSIVAPFSHYAFMMVSDAYHMDMAGHQHDMHHAHGTSGHGVTTNGVTANDADNAHFVCEYADLFATFSATSPVSIVLMGSVGLSQVLDEAVQSAPYTSPRFQFYLRGPPLPVHSV